LGFLGVEELIVADVYERKVIGKLRAFGTEVEVRRLEAGDYLIGGEPPVSVERKTVQDLVNSLKGGRLWDELRKLKAMDGTHVLIVEGQLASIRRYSRFSLESLMGLLASIALDWSILIIPSQNASTTAKLLSIMARRGSEAGGGRIPIYKPKAESPDDELLRIVASFPMVSSVKARSLLEAFGSVRAIVNASKEELMSVRNVGPKTAEAIEEASGRRFGGKK
jgi:ERCC4-type nuclease